MEEMYSRLAPVWDTLLTIVGFKRGLCHYVLDSVSFGESEKIKVLDVGCGTGMVSFAFLEKFPEARVIATDINKDMVTKTLETAGKKGLNGDRLTVGIADASEPSKIKLLDGGFLELEPDSIDVVVASGVLEYVPLEESILNLLNLLKKEGILIVVSVKDSFPVGKLWGKIYKFKPIKQDYLEERLVYSGCRLVKKSPLTIKNFPANMTRTGMLGVK